MISRIEIAPKMASIIAHDFAQQFRSTVQGVQQIGKR
jgi:hypothetical protein